MNYTTKIENAKLWWPYGYGEPNLYTVEMQLLYHGDIVDSRTERIGLRTVQLERNLGTVPANAVNSIHESEPPTPGSSLQDPNQQFKFIVNNGNSPSMFHQTPDSMHLLLQEGQCL